jgi:hypothetical protein
LLRELRAMGTARLSLTPIAIDRYLAWCAEQNRDPEDPDNRSAYASALLNEGVAHPWPPARNDPCWCRRAQIQEMLPACRLTTTGTDWPAPGWSGRESYG